MQLTTVYSVLATFSNITVSYVRNLLACRINAVFCYLRTVFDNQTIFINSNSFVATIIDLQAVFRQLSRFISAVFNRNAICIHLSVACCYSLSCYSIYSDVFFQFYLNSTAVYGCFDIRVITFNFNSFTKRFLHGLTVFRFKTETIGFKAFNSTMQLTAVNSVFAIFGNRTVLNISNLLACCIDAVLRHRWTIGNLHAVFCNSCQRITGCIFNSHAFTVHNGFTVCTVSSVVESNGVQVFKVFCQTNIENIIFADNTNIVFSQIIFVC